MPTELKMPALSPTMEEGTLAKWLVKEGDTVKSGDLLAEIETDKATMEFEAVDEGVISKILVAEGTDGVKVGTAIALIAGEGESVDAPAAAPAPAAKAPEEKKPEPAAPAKGGGETPAAAPAPVAAPKADSGDRVKASPLARRLAEAQGIDLASLRGSGPGGRIVRADLGAGAGGTLRQAQGERISQSAQAEPVEARPVQPFETEIPHEAVKLSNMRKTIARRLTESKQQIPHIYLTVDVQLDALLKLRGELNASLAPRGVKLSVNDMLIKALAAALIEVPECNVSFAGDTLIKYSRADISVAVSIPGGLITPIVADAGNKAISAIAKEMHDLASRAKEGKLQPAEYQGGTASLSNMGTRTYAKYQAGLSRDFYLNPFHKIHLNGAWFGGRDLDRFAKYQFGLFDDTRIHGVPASGVRYGELAMARGSYSINIFEQYRFDVFLDQAWGRDEPGRGGWQPLSGFGVAVNVRAPFNTIFRADLGKSLLPARYGSLGSTTLQIMFLKPLR